MRRSLVRISLRVNCLLNKLDVFKREDFSFRQIDNCSQYSSGTITVFTAPLRTTDNPNPTEGMTTDYKNGYVISFLAHEVSSGVAACQFRNLQIQRNFRRINARSRLS